MRRVQPSLVYVPKVAYAEYAPSGGSLIFAPPRKQKRCSPSLVNTLVVIRNKGCAPRYIASAMEKQAKIKIAMKAVIQIA